MQQSSHFSPAATSCSCSIIQQATRCQQEGTHTSNPTQSLLKHSWLKACPSTAAARPLLLCATWCNHRRAHNTPSLTRSRGTADALLSLAWKPRAVPSPPSLLLVTNLVGWSQTWCCYKRNHTRATTGSSVLTIQLLDVPNKGRRLCDDNMQAGASHTYCTPVAHNPWFTHHHTRI